MGLELAGGFRLARAGAALARRPTSDLDGDESPAESGDELPHSKAMQARAGGLQPPSGGVGSSRPMGRNHAQRGDCKSPARGAAVSQTSRSGCGRRGLLRVVLRTHPRSGGATTRVVECGEFSPLSRGDSSPSGWQGFELAGGFRLARAGAAWAKGRASDRDGGKPPAESGDKSPHSKATTGEARPLLGLVQCCQSNRNAQKSPQGL